MHACDLITHGSVYCLLLDFMLLLTGWTCWAYAATQQYQLVEVRDRTKCPRVHAVMMLLLCDLADAHASDFPDVQASGVSVCVCVSMCLGVTGLVSLKNASGEGP